MALQANPLTPRPSGRLPQQLRAVRLQRGYTCHAEGSVLVGHQRRALGL